MGDQPPPDAPPPAPPPSPPPASPPPAAGPPPGWVAPPPAGYAAPQTEGSAIAALVLSIASFVVCPLIPAIVALVLAHTSQQKIDASGGRLTGGSLNTAARVISWVNIGLCIFGIVVIVIVAAAGGFDTDDNDFDNDFGFALTFVRARFGF